MTTAAQLMVKVGADISEAVSGLNRVGETVISTGQRIGGAMQSAGNAVKGFGRDVAGISVPVAAGFGAAALAATNLGSALATATGPGGGLELYHPHLKAQLRPDENENGRFLGTWRGLEACACPLRENKKKTACRKHRRYRRSHHLGHINTFKFRAPEEYLADKLFIASNSTPFYSFENAVLFAGLVLLLTGMLVLF